MTEILNNLSKIRNVFYTTFSTLDAEIDKAYQRIGSQSGQLHALIKAQEEEKAQKSTIKK